MRHPGVLAVGVAALLAPGLAGAQTPTPTLQAALTADLKACLQGVRWQYDAAHLAITADQAPGLPGGMLIARVPNASGKLLVYQDNGGGSLTECGVALYGEIPDGLVASLTQVITTARPALRPASPDAWRLPGQAGASTLYWGDPKAPGLNGVTLRRSEDAIAGGPALQVDSHAILVR